MATNKVLQSAFSRVFLIEGRAGPTHAPLYESCMKMGGVSQNYGDITRIECPDPYQYGKFIEVASIRGAEERATTSLQGRYALDAVSDILRLARKGCAIDAQLHIGQCTNPSEFDSWDKVIVLENAYVTSYSTDDLGALASADNAVVNENADISAESIYEIRKLAFTTLADATITVPIVDGVIGDVKNCGTDCETESDGCQKVFVVDADTVYYSLDGGSTWYSSAITGITTEVPVAIDVVSGYVIVACTTGSCYYHAPKEDFDGVTSITWTKVAVATKAPSNLFSVGNFAWVVGADGYIWSLISPSTGVTVVDAGAATASALNAVHALDANHAVACGAAGAVVYTEDGENWLAAAVPVVAVLNCVWMRSKTEWWVGTAGGAVYYTLNKGVSWTSMTFSGSGSGSVTDIAFHNGSVGYIAHTPAAGDARLLRTYNGGYSWKVLPETSATLPTSSGIAAIMACTSDPNTVFAVGAATADGVIIKGTAG